MILVINTGSSSIKMSLLKRSSMQLLAEGLTQRLGEELAQLNWTIGKEDIEHHLKAANHQRAMAQMLDILFSKIDKTRVIAVGHRVVHGGEEFVVPTLLNAQTIIDIEALSHLAPLHNPSNILGVKAATFYLPNVPHIAVFDTSFHQSMPKKSSMYAVPYAWYESYGVRRYGFHGTSHHYVGLEAAKILGRDFNDCSLLVAHLGNGCSASAISHGLSVDTTMGLTPLEGLVMGTRSGDVDPGLIDFISRQTGDSLEKITGILNRESGLLGLSGCSNDMRTLLQASETGDERAALALEVFCYRLAKALAGLTVALRQLDAIVFTGGIGEHASWIRSKTLAQLKILGVMVDKEYNRTDGKESRGYISADDSNIAVLVVPTDEEKMIAGYVCAALES
ncbi:MAG: acetate kinase [Mariprofundaceae bacterium]